MDGVNRLWTGTRNAVEPREDILDIFLNQRRQVRDKSRSLRTHVAGGQSSSDRDRLRRVAGESIVVARASASLGNPKVSGPERVRVAPPE